MENEQENRTPTQTNDRSFKCEFINPNGQRCRANHLHDSTLCLWHDQRPEIIQKRNLAVMRGGKTKISDGLENWKKVDPETSKEVMKILTVIVNETASGRMNHKVASTIIQAANIMLRAIAQGDLEDRMCTVERKLGLR